MQIPKLQPGDRYIHAKDFYTRLGISKAKFYSMIKDGRIPQPVRISERNAVWPLSLVEDYITKGTTAETAQSQQPGTSAPAITPSTPVSNLELEVQKLRTEVKSMRLEIEFFKKAAAVFARGAI
ncbi:MAG: AlpA family phage regulatory protein [Desulfovibrio desulfuricans]|nr:AlpA family phage regulatory protein [Desulfovibrio desulfuricans]